MHLIHRGIVNKLFKENLLISFKQSFKKGYGIETDIHATKDNEFICFHDFTLKRILKRNLSVKNLNYSKIKEISTKLGKPIPLLKDLLKAFIKNLSEVVFCTANVVFYIHEKRCQFRTGTVSVPDK